MSADKATILAQLSSLVGENHVLTAPDAMESYLVERRDLWHGKALCVVRPANTAEVSAVLKFCNDNRIGVVPQGGNTGLVGGQTPDTSGNEIVLSLTRLNTIREIDTTTNTMTVDAGVILQTVQQTADENDRLFPLSLASEGTCTIGGNLASNAGGTAVLAYGNARELVNGLEVVLADGRVLSNLSKLKKDNTGYDLKHLFMGSEGTLGVITAAVLKMYPKPRSVQTAFIAVPSPHEALALLLLAQSRAGNDVKAFEIMPRIGIDFVMTHVPGMRDPFADKYEWYILLELASQSDSGLVERALALLEEAMEQELVLDAVLATSQAQRTAFWGLRENLSDVQKREGGSIKHDISVPVAKVPAFLDEAGPAVEKTIPGARLVPFGHLGDGNIHYNVQQPVGMDKQAYLDRWEELNEVVHAIAMRYDGSISAEHGIGVLKRDLLPGVKDPVTLDVMRMMKHTLDPNGILNPGKVLPS